MRRSTARAAYKVLLGLHPSGFRGRFGEEMLEVFDEAAVTYGQAWLLRDVAVSLLRRRLLREDRAAAEVSVGLLAGTYPALLPPHLTVGKLGMAFVLSAMLYGLIGPM